MVSFRNILSVFSLSGLVMALAGCGGPAVLNFLTPDSGYTLRRDVPYGSDARQKLDVYAATSPDPGHSVILFFYGGSWQFGSKDDYKFFAQALAAQGYTTVVADYRIYPSVRFPAFVNDAADALVWTSRNIASFGGNPDRIFVAGHSAGAYLALMLAANDIYVRQAGGTASMIRGSIGIAGPYNFLPLTDPALIDIFSTAPAANTQPYNYVSAGMPPALLATGTDDDTVLPANSETMAVKMQTSGVDVALRHYHGIGHVGVMLSAAQGFRWRSSLLEDIRDFVQNH